MDNQLNGIKVLELASVLAGPSVGQFFAEVGADVIKVESLPGGGDVTRSWKSSDENTDDRSAYFTSVNWGKRSLALDLSKPDGQEIILQLAETADIVIASYKPGDAQKLRVDYQTLSQRNSGLIYGQITGYGSNNFRVGYDAIIQAESGFMFMNGEPGGRSLKMPVALMDILAGHQLKEGILLALINRIKNGHGGFIEVSLIQAAIASLANQAANWLVGKNLPQKQGSAHPNIAPYGDVFTTQDDKEILLAVGSQKQFNALALVLQLPELLSDERFSTNTLRVKNRIGLNDILASRIRSVSAFELLPILHDAAIPAGIIQNLQEVFGMEEAKELLISASNIHGVRTYVGNHVQTSEKVSHFKPPPHLGEHTDEILRESLKFSSESIEKLKISGVIA